MNFQIEKKKQLLFIFILLLLAYEQTYLREGSQWITIVT